MAIFSRRTIQRLIEENNSVFRMPVKEQIKVLNIKNDSFNNEFLAREWEIVVLNAFAHTFKEFGKVTHEKKFNQKPLDIFFESTENPKLNFVADICSVTDYGTDKRFPIEILERKYYQLIDKRNFCLNFFNIKIGDNSNFVSRGKGVVLFLPTEEDFDKKVFNEKFNAFLDSVEENPSSSHNLLINEVEFKLPTKGKRNLYNKNLIWFFRAFHKTKLFRRLLNKGKFRKVFDEYVRYIQILMSYNPNQRFSNTVANSHKNITLLENNTLFYRLREKHKQLTGSKTPYPKGIIICDGNYEAFSTLYSGGGHWTGKHYDIRDIINHFFKKPDFQEIDFILFFGVYPYGETRKIISKCFARNKERKLDELILEILKGKDLISNFPKPHSTVGNAVNHLKSKYKNIGAEIGGYELSNNKIKISSRAILEILAGETTIEDFTEINFHPLVGNPFKAKLKEGRLISSVEIENTEDEQDDEYLVFNFGEPDVAISDFKNPAVQKKK